MTDFYVKSVVNTTETDRTAGYIEFNRQQLQISKYLEIYMDKIIIIIEFKLKSQSRVRVMVFNATSNNISGISWTCVLCNDVLVLDWLYT
jgi:hypothetical protein